MISIKSPEQQKMWSYKNRHICVRLVCGWWTRIDCAPKVLCYFMMKSCEWVRITPVVHQVAADRPICREQIGLLICINWIVKLSWVDFGTLAHYQLERNAYRFTTLPVTPSLMMSLTENVNGTDEPPRFPHLCFSTVVYLRCFSKSAVLYSALFWLLPKLDCE